MLFVPVFLTPAATTSCFPEWSWVTVLLASFGCAAGLRILLAVTSRAGVAQSKTGRSRKLGSSFDSQVVFAQPPGQPAHIQGIGHRDRDGMRLARSETP